MLDRFCPTCGKKVSELAVLQLERCSSCGTPIPVTAFDRLPKESTSKPPFPLARFLIALLSPAAATLLISLFYKPFIWHVPWLQNYVVPQVLGLGIMAIGCAAYAGYLLGRGKSELARILSFALACVLIFINLFCVVLAGCSM